METPPLCAKQTLRGSLSKSSLTPCRRLGLSRLSSSSLKKSLRVSVVNTPDSGKTGTNVSNDVKVPNETPVKRTFQPDCDEKKKVPLKPSDVENEGVGGYKVRARRCLTVSCKTPSKVKKNCEDQSSDKLHFTEVNTQSYRKRKRSHKIENDEIEEDDETAKASSVLNTDESFVSTEDKAESNDSVEEVTPEMIEMLVKSIQERKKKLEELRVQETYAKKHNLEDLKELTNKWKKAGEEVLQYSAELAKQAGFAVTIKQLMTQHDFPEHLMGYNSEDDEFL